MINNREPVPVPILIVIPYWEGDKEYAFELCKIISGLQEHPVKPDVAHVLLVCRQDSSIDLNMVEIVREKFTVFTFHSMSPLKGWPAGSNGLFSQAMIHISHRATKNYECIYWMEPDAIPICPNWFWDLVIEWRNRHPTTNIVGCRSDCNGDGTGDHITGCALYHPNIARILPEITLSDHMAWDYEHRAKIVRMGGPTKMIENFYRARDADSGILSRADLGVRIIHGFKDRSLINLVKQKYNIL